MPARFRDQIEINLKSGRQKKAQTEPTLHWICHQLPFFSALLQKTAYLLQTGSLPFPPLSDVFKQPSFTGEQSMGAGVSYFENVRPPGISYQESASHQKQAVLEGYQSCCRGNSPRGGERFRNCSQPAWSTLWNPCEKEMVFLCVSFDIAILFLSAFQHANCLERWGVKDLILRSLCRCCC